LKNNKTVHDEGGRQKVRWWCFKVVRGSVSGYCASLVAEEWNCNSTME